MIRLVERLEDWRRSRRERREAAAWDEQGRPVPPPPALKRETLRDYAHRFGLTVFVETGTYLGDTTAVLKDEFRRVVSIELSEPLYERARRRFARSKHVELLQGDSGKILQPIVSKLEVPALFWLDGHYSAGITAKGEHETPVFEELEGILASPVSGHVVLVDDARLFTGRNGWPSLDRLRAFVVERNPRTTFDVVDDIIRIETAHSDAWALRALSLRGMPD